MNKQKRRSLNLPTEVYRDLSYLQFETRLLMQKQNIEFTLSKTAVTKILEALIKNINSKQLLEILK